MSNAAGPLASGFESRAGADALTRGGGAGRRILVVGASGVIGRAALAHFDAHPGFHAVGLSRRSPGLRGANHVALDLLDRDATLATLAQLPEITHVVYCALQESPGLIGGWFDPEQMKTNRQMLANLLDGLSSSRSFVHLSLLQGAKAYGAHLGTMRVPGREREPRDEHENFYWLQEDLLRERAARDGFAFTIWRPPVMFGHAVGAPMNPLAAIAAFASLRKAAGLPLVWPGGRTVPADGLDARLLARAFEWATEAPSARGETFNITNGDVFVWENLWPSVAATLEMEMGAPEPIRLQNFLPEQAGHWDTFRRAQGLRSPALLDWVGDSAVYVDVLFGTARGETSDSILLSTIKLREAGFHPCIDSEDMLRDWLGWLREERWLPS
jgi:nucleoside-diphosphate-sugar epimerase